MAGKDLPSYWCLRARASRNSSNAHVTQRKRPPVPSRQSCSWMILPPGQSLLRWYTGTSYEHTLWYVLVVVLTPRSST